jgi:hypothetical protein
MASKTLKALEIGGIFGGLPASMSGIMMGYIGVTQGVLETTSMVEPANPSSPLFTGSLSFGWRTRSL